MKNDGKAQFRERSLVALPINRRVVSKSLNRS